MAFSLTVRFLLSRIYPRNQYPISFQFSSIKTNLKRSFSLIMSNHEHLHKKSKADQPIIGTHSGTFHCDEALACFMLKQTPAYANATILRSRELIDLEQCDIVVDVGNVFDHEKKRYDHHQRTFVDTLSTLRPEFGQNYKIRLSSAGLIYTYYGEEVIKAILEKNGADPLKTRDMQLVYKQIYKSFIQEIDAIDNGVPMFDAEPLYTISTHISARIANLNPSWEIVDYNLDEIFETAMEKVGAEFTEVVLSIGSSWIKARGHIRDSIENAKNIHHSGEILELTRFCPWKQHLAQLESEYKIEGIPKYVIFNEKPNSWRVICVPNQPSSFVCRKFLHQSWCGLRAEELEKKSGIANTTFVHHSGFIGGATTRDAVLQMAIKSLEST